MWEAVRQDAAAVKLPVEDHVATIEALVANFFRDDGLLDHDKLVAALRKALASRALSRCSWAARASESHLS
jgi:hypothetical protein